MVKDQAKAMRKILHDKWSDTLLLNRKSFETDKRENLHTGVLIMSCGNSV